MSQPGAGHTVLDAIGRSSAAVAGWSYDHRWIVLGIAAALVAGSLALASRAEIDNSYEAYFDPDEPAYLAYEQYREDFGSDEVSYILYDAPDAEYGVWDLDVMRRIATLTRALEDEVPFIYEVESLVNAEIVEGVPDGIEITRLEDEFPATQEALLELRERILAKPMLVGGLAAEDRRHGAIMIEMDRSSTDPPEAICHDPDRCDELENLYPQVTESTIAAILARPEYEGIDFYHAGDVPLNTAYNRLIFVESAELDAITSVVIALVLLLAFRTGTGALAPVAVVQICVLTCVALIALLGWKLDMSFGSVPTLLTAIGVAHSVHILSEFDQRLRALGDRREALVQTVALVSAPCLMTSITTAIGFASLAVVPILSISHQGIYAAFGVMAAFVMSFTVLMALLSMGRREIAGIAAALAALAAGAALADRGAGPAIGAAVVAGAVSGVLTLRFADRRMRGPDRGRSDRLQRALRAVADFDVRHRRPILVGFAALFAVCAVGMTRIVVDSNWLDDFSDAVPLKHVTQRVDRVMGGSTNVIYLFDAGEPDGIMEPSVLREMDRIHRIGAEHALVRKSYSLVDVLKDLNEAFHGGDPAYYRVPDSRELVAQYLLLYETAGGEEARELVSPDYRRASVEFRLALAPTSATAELVEAIDAELASGAFASDVSLTGIGALWLILLDHIVWGQISGFLLAFGMIALIMIGLFRSLGTGLISMVPNLAPVALALGVMGWAGIFLDYNKISIAAVAIGIAVDDTIHMLVRYRHEFRRCGDYALALQGALREVGRALLITSVALISGFLVLLASSLDSTATYGILLATTIVTALVADFLLMPALVLTFQPFGPEGARGSETTRLSEAA